MKNGKFVVIEGGVGSGKSTVFNKLKRKLKGWSFYREPGGTLFGERIRKAVQGLYHYPVDKYAAMFGYTASRANLVRNKIIPDLESGKNVLIDRYWFSTYAYQGSEGVDKKEILEISRLATNGLMPDLVIHLDQDPKIGITRKLGNKGVDRYDLKKLKFHQILRKNYLQLSKRYKRIWKVIDSSSDKKTVFEEVWKIVEKELN